VGWEWDLSYCVGNGGMGTLISAISSLFTKCFQFFIYQPEDGQWKGPKHVVDPYVINYTYLHHLTVVLDKYIYPNLIYRIFHIWSGCWLHVLEEFSALAGGWNECIDWSSLLWHGINPPVPNSHWLSYTSVYLNRILNGQLRIKKILNQMKETFSKCFLILI